MIRETLTDLRDIINNASSPELAFDELLADLRSQISEHLFAAGVGLRWVAESDDTGALPIATAHTLRSIVREAVRNAIAHGAPHEVQVEVRQADGTLSIRVADDGRGFDTAGTVPGNGLTNMRARAESLGGTCEIASGPGGSSVAVRIPARPEAGAP
nr:ATP-binding protein [Roseibacterium persicicum]